jgi:ATP-dependent helicase/nuclease subunit B
VLARGNEYLTLARALDAPDTVKHAERPQPKPPRAARPAKLSVTAIEDWLRDPYTIYAKYILRLAPLDAVDTPPGARDRGTVIHGAIGDYTKLFPHKPPTDPLKELVELGEQHFAPLADIRKHAPSGGRATNASHAVSPAGTASAAPASPRCMLKSKEN